MISIFACYLFFGFANAQAVRFFSHTCLCCFSSKGCGVFILDDDPIVFVWHLSLLSCSFKSPKGFVPFTFFCCEACSKSVDLCSFFKCGHFSFCIFEISLIIFFKALAFGSLFQFLYCFHVLIVKLRISISLSFIYFSHKILHFKFFIFLFWGKGLKLFSVSLCLCSLMVSWSSAMISLAPGPRASENSSVKFFKSWAITLGRFSSG